MSNALDTLKAILGEKLSGEQVQALMAELTIASGEGAVAIAGDATGAVTLTGSQNIAGNNNQVVIHQGINADELVKILHDFLGARDMHETIRFLMQELQLMRSQRPNLSCDTPQDTENFVDSFPFKKLIIAPSTLERINKRMEVIEEIYHAGYLPITQQSELRKLKQRLQTLNTLNQDLQNIAEQGDRLIQESVAAMRLQLNALKLAWQTMPEDIKASVPEMECQQIEATIFERFVHGLEDSRVGSEWIENNIDSLQNYAHHAVIKAFPELNAIDQSISDFKLSLKHFLQHISLSLYWGTYKVLDSPNIPLVLGVEQYETAFRAMKESISPRLRSETIQAIEESLDYLIDRLKFYE